MKRLVIIFVAALFVANLWAGDVKLQKVYKEKTYEDRIGTIVPYVYQEKNSLTVYSDYWVNDMRIKVTDVTGQIVYSEIVTLLPEQLHTITIDPVNEGMYRLEIECEKTIYEGYFEIE